MDIVPIYKRVIGLDVHQAQITGCAITEQPDGSVTYERREFGGFKRDRKALAEWARSIGPDIVVMESTGIYWKSPYAALEGVGIVPWVVNARHVKAGAAHVAARNDSVLGLIYSVKAGIGLGALPTALGDAEPDLVRVLGPIPELTRIWRVLTTPELRHTPRVSALFDFLVDEVDTLRPIITG